MHYWLPALVFIINTVFQLFSLIILLRFLLKAFQISFHNPLSQHVLTFSHPLTHPLQSLLPKHSRIDWAALTLLIGIKAIHLLLLHGLTLGTLPTFSVMVCWPAGQIVTDLINFFFFAIILLTLLSWINPRTLNWFTVMLNQFIEPFLTPIRKRLPTSGLDFSPLLALLGLKLLELLIAYPLISTLRIS